MKLAAMAVAMLLAAFSADALCIGQSVRDVTDEMAAHTHVIGGGPTDWKVSSCGGGVDEYGEPIQRWRCFVQTWKVQRENGQPDVAALFFYWGGGTWRLSGAATSIGMVHLERCDP